MPFDAATATPVGRFDPGTAMPVNNVTAAQLRARDPSEYDPSSQAFKDKYAPPSWGRRLLGNIRGAAGMLSGIPASLGGGLAYLGTLAGTGGITPALGDPAAAKAVQEAVQNKLTYKPDDRLAQDYQQEANSNLQWLGPKEGEIAGEKTAEVTGSPALGAAVNTGINAIPMLAGVRIGGVRGGSVREVVPTIPELKTAANTAYSAARGSGELVPQTAFQPLLKDVEGYLTEKGYHPDENPSAARQLNRLEEEATRPDADLTSMTGIDAIRKGLVNSENSAYARSQPGKTSPDAMMASEIVDKFDKWVDDNAPQAGESSATARDAWRRYRNSETIQSLFDRAEVRAGQYSNAGPENALRVQFAQLANNPRRLGYFNAEEQAAIRRVATASDTQLALRQVGKLFSPHSFGGALLSSATGGLLGLPAGLAAAGIGALSKGAAGRMRINAANRTRDTVALGRAPGISAIRPRSGVSPVAVLPASQQGQ